MPKTREQASASGREATGTENPGKLLRAGRGAVGRGEGTQAIKDLVCARQVRGISLCTGGVVPLIYRWGN